MLQDVFESEEFAAAPVLTPQQESHYLQAYLPLVRKVVRQLARSVIALLIVRIWNKRR